MRRLAPFLSLALCAAACGGNNKNSGTEGASETSDGSTASSGETDAPTTTAPGTTTTETTAAPTTTEPETGSTTTDPTTGGGADVPGCDGGSFLPVPADTSLPGPWPVGARTVTVGALTVEVWYPAELGSDAGQDAIRYDIRQSLPDSEVDKVSDADNPWQDCECYRDLPLDTGHGPYPAVVFVHGTAGFRSQSLEHMVHWASRGFIVVAADHPGLWLKDMLGMLCGQGGGAQNLGADLGALVAAIKAPVGDIGFIAGHVDGDRIAMAGHSAGGNAISGSGGARVLIPMAAGGTKAGAALESSLIFGGQADAVVAYSGQQSGYADSPAPKRLVGIANAGHLAFSSLCSLENAQGQDFLEIATANGVCGAQFAGFLFDCDPNYTADSISWEITQYASSAVLESVLRCTDAADNFATLETKYPDVAEYLEEL